MKAKYQMIDPGMRIGYTIIYAWSCPYEDHKGFLKIGQTERFYPKRDDDTSDNSECLRKAAEVRILEDTKTAGIKFNIEYVTLLCYQIEGDGELPKFDFMVRKVLTNSGFKKAEFDHEAGIEWVICNINAVKAAVKAVNENRSALYPEEVKNLKDIPPIRFYPHQKDCLKWTQQQFKKHSDLLWEIKPRGGKTVTAIEITRRLGFKKTLVYTSRPDVNHEWKNAFDLIFTAEGGESLWANDPQAKTGDAKWAYGSRAGEGISDFDELMEAASGGRHVIWFASTQFLRRTDETSTAEMRKQILDTDWDFIIIDEAHEATLTELGQMVEAKAKKENTKILKLSGTPFNLLDRYSKEEVFTFDYNDEMTRKTEWDEKREGYANPYARMPQIHLRTVTLASFVKSMKTEDNAFSFKEFFRTKPDSLEFVHDEDVSMFLDLLKNEDKESFYPYCCDHNRGFFRHTLWMVPGVEAGKALSQKLQQHPYFSGYKIINVCGDGDEEKPTEQATKAVRDGIANYWKKDKFGTITLSCGKLTTGVTIPEWTGVLMLKGGNSTDAKLYLQTAFRVQGPYDSPEGIRKTSCYVFDFAPDRALTIFCRIAQANKNGDKGESKKKAEKLLKFFPVLSYDGNSLIEHNVETLFRWYNKAAAERVMANGFDDNRLYNWDKISEAANSDAILDEINKNWGGKKSGANTKHVVNAQGAEGDSGKSEIRWTCPNCHKKDNVEPVCPHCGTPRPKSRWLCSCGHANYDTKFCGECGKPKPEKPKDEAKDRATKLISTLRNISIRIPMLAFGADVESDDEFRLDNFASLIDDKSWVEFMPEGFPKETDGEKLGFDYFRQFIDEDIFVIACTDTRNELKEADNLMPEERVKALISIIGKFKNPAKETIITPWPVVNLHLGETIGGEVFYDVEGQDFRRALPTPAMIDHHGKGILADIHTDVFWDENAKVLEINSKSGVYPLFLAYSMYRIHSTLEGEKVFDVELWKKILEKNIFVLCQTEMAVKITNRVLRGFHLDWKTNCICKDNLVEILKERFLNEKTTINEISTPAFWGINDEDMIKFTLAASNPPYQGSSHLQIYPLFYMNATEIADTVTMIFPSNWQVPVKKSSNGLDWMNKDSIKCDKQIVFIDNRNNVFEGISGAAETNIILWRRNYDNGLSGNQLVYTDGKTPINTKLLIDFSEIDKPSEIVELVECVKSIEGDKFKPFEVSRKDPFKISSDVFKLDTKGIFTDTPQYDNDIRIWGVNDRKRIVKYHINDFEEIPHRKKDGTIDRIDMVSKSTGFKFRKTGGYNTYKVLIPRIWGNMSASSGIGGAYAELPVAGRYDVCSETYNYGGITDSQEHADYVAKYAFTKFFRALLFYYKNSKHTSYDAFLAIPSQDFHEEWWSETIAEIDERLFDKYNVPEPIRSFVRNNIQTRTEENIVNL